MTDGTADRKKRRSPRSQTVAGTRLDHPDPLARAAAAAALGLGGRLPSGAPVTLAELVRSDPDGAVRAASLAALVRHRDRVGEQTVEAAWEAAATDTDPAVRRRAVELAPALGPSAAVATRVVGMVDDPDPLVAETAAFALGEMGPAALAAGATAALAAATAAHPDPLVREAAVAALGSLGDPEGLPAVLRATSDRPAVRRRAVLALAAFDGPEVEAALEAALHDRDWQVRQAAEDLIARPAPREHGGERTAREEDG